MIFGTSPITPNELVGELNRRATETAQTLDPLDRNTAWTTAIKHALAVMAAKHELRPFYSNRKEGISEFLLDVVWWEQDSTSRRAVLGVECEWGNPWDRSAEGRAEAIVEDFEKLLQFKAPLKLMIFSANNVAMRTAIHDKLLEYLRSFAQHASGECYVFMEFASSGQCYSYTCDIKKDGRDADLQIVPIDDASRSALSKAASAT
jgi:hypothetical protein